MNVTSYVIRGFLRQVDKNRALLGYYSASSGNFLPTFRDNVSVPSLLTSPEERSSQ